MVSRIFPSDSCNLVEQRQKQINSLKIFNDNVVEVQEGVEYHVGFICGGQNLALLITLPPQFPMEKPIMKLSQPVGHHWVNEEGVIAGAPGLVNFSQYLELGRVVQAVIRELEKSCPPLLFSYLPYSVSTEVPLKFPELKNWSVEDLEKLNEDEDYQYEFIQSLEDTKQLDNLIEEMMAKNEALATENLAKQPLLEKAQQGTIEKIESFTSCKTTFEDLTYQHQSVTDKYSPKNIKECLREAQHQSDEESEKIAEMFLNEEINVDQFLARYVQKRMLSHARKFKEERLSVQLTQREKAGY